MNSFKFVTVVWGADFTDNFLKVCLPSLLFPNNLVYFARHTNSIYRIYTTTKDAETIRKSSVYMRLSAIMPVEIAIISGMSFVEKYKPQTQCHAHFIQTARDEDCAFIFLIPDAVWADGAFARLLDISNSGKRMVVISTPRLAKETFVSAFKEGFTKDDTIQPIMPRQLVKMAMDHLHPDSISQFWNPKKHSGTIRAEKSWAPGNFYWPVNQEGLLIRQFFLFPLMVRPVDKEVVPAITIDDDYTLNACPNLADVYIVQDSDDICALDFTSISEVQEATMTGGQSLKEVADWAKQCAHKMHCEFIKYKIRFHWGDCSGNWKDVEQQSDAVVEATLSLIEDSGNASSSTPLSKRRYLSPSFLLGKVRQKGAIRFFKQVFSTVVQSLLSKIYRNNIKIRMVTDAHTVFSKNKDPF